MKKKFVLLFIILALSLFYGCTGNENKTEEPQSVTETQTEVTTSPETTTNPESTNNPSTTKKAESSGETERRNTDGQTTTKQKDSDSDSSNNKEHSSKHSASPGGGNSSSGSISSTTSSTSTHQHSMPTGNMGWFNSREALVSYYQGIVNSWNTKYENGEITWDEYVANVPGGYECWSCSGCGKWTGNFKSQTVY